MRTRARALATSLEYTSPAGPAPSHRTHSILRARAHPSAVGIGQADPARRGETPKRLRRLPIPTAVKTSLPSLSQRSGVEAAAAAAAAAALPEVAAPLSAGRWRVRRAVVARLRPLRPRASWPRRPPSQTPGAFCLAQSGRLHHISDTSLSFSPLRLPPVHSAPHARRRPPADCRPPGLEPADVSTRAMLPLQKVAAAAAAGGR